MKSVIFDRFGEPREVLRVIEAPPVEPGAGEARVRMQAAPVNPSDLMVVRGLYGRLPKLPATPGFEGVGVVEVAGAGVLKWIRGLKPGRRVAVLNGSGGNWQESVVVPARQLVPLPDDVPDEQAASFFVNPATVLAMTERVLKVPAGSWLVQTAAASALGRMVIRLGKHQGFRTINLVRRAEQVEQLKALGADAAFNTEEGDVEERVRGLTQGQGVPFALDAVGGRTGALAARCLGAGGRMLVYGTLSGEPIPLEPRLLMAGQKSVEGFWLSEWVKQQSIFSMLGLFRQITDLLRKQVLTTHVEASYALEQIQDAVVKAETPGRQGKVLLRMNDTKV